jgi:hypothetical protein
MNETTTLSAAAGSGSASLALLVIFNWIVGFWGITIPPDVQQAAGTILTIAIHYIVTTKFCAINTAAEVPASQQKPGE